jgi:mannose-6-phosphate isomerase-like protein (cupin superfamily)
MVARLDFAVASPADFAQLRHRFADLPMRPKLLRTRDGGTDISSPGRQSLSLLVGEETAGALYATDVYLSPGFGAPPHHQPTEEELWYLLEGELDVRVGTRSALIKAGSFAFIPRDTSHTFKNNGQAPVRLLAWNAPAGHERAFEAMRAKAEQGITAFPELREVFRAHEIVLHSSEHEKARNDAAGGKLVLERGQGRDASQSGADVRVLLEAQESGGLFEVSDVLLGHGLDLPLRYERSDTCFYLVGGMADLTIGDDRQRVAAGAFAFIPRGHPVRIANAGEQPTHFVLWTTPAAPLRMP